MKKLFLGIILIALVSQVKAQESETTKTISRFGVKTSLNLSGVRFANSEFQEFLGSETDRLVNGSFGIYGETGHDYYVTQIGLQYFGKGFSAENNYSTRFHTLQVPLMFNFRLPIADQFGLQMGLGGYGSVAFMAIEDDDGTTNEDLLSFKRKLESGDEPDDVKMYHPLDFGLSFGGNFEWEYMEGKIVELGFQYDLGLWKVTNDMPLIEGSEEPINPGMKNNAFVISVAFLFDKNGIESNDEQ
ncbi:MAG: outer membrane beta-barrel protein [Bacteroidales bacterium]